MGLQRKEGYSASVAADLSVRGRRVQVAKINRDYLTLAEQCELAPKTEAQLNITIDDKKSSRTIQLDDGVSMGQRQVRYSVLAPF